MIYLRTPPDEEGDNLPAACIEGDHTPNAYGICIFCWHDCLSEEPRETEEDDE